MTMDLAALDRAVAAAARDLAKERAAWATGSLDTFVWSRHRALAGRSLYDDVRARNVSLHERELRDALLVWIAALTVARVSGPAELAYHRIADEALAPVTLERVTQLRWREVWAGLLSETTAPRARAYAAALPDLAPRLAPALRELAAVRHEALSRLEGAADRLGAPEDARARALAVDFLAATEDLSRDLLRAARKRDPAPWPLALDVLMARDAREGWPAGSLSRWLSELFSQRARGLSVELPKLAAPLGGASFARALGYFGAGLRVAIGGRTSVGRPFRNTDAHRFSGTFALLASSPEFLRRKLGVSREVAVDQARVVLRSQLVSLRLECAASLVRAGALGVDELGARVFGEELRLSGAWPQSRVDGESRLAGWLGAPLLGRDLRDRHDEDWFDNPRAWADLRAGHVVGSAIGSDGFALQIARMCEQALS